MSDNNRTYEEGFEDGQKKAREHAMERVQWYLTDLAFRAPELWPTHGDLLELLKHDMEHLRIVETP